MFVENLIVVKQRISLMKASSLFWYLMKRNFDFFRKQILSSQAVYENKYRVLELYLHVLVDLKQLLDCDLSRRSVPRGRGT